MTDVYDWYTDEEWCTILKQMDEQERIDNLPENKRKRRIKEIKNNIESLENELKEMN